MESLKKTRECRISFQDTWQDAMMKMSEGNPGALTVMMELMMKGGDIDRAALMGGLANILNLDMMGVYGPHIWILYKDQCGEDLERTIAVIRAVQLGLMDGDAVRDALRVANDEGTHIPLDVDGALAKVKEQLGDKWVSPIV